MYPITIPLHKWFECQKWLSQNYLFPGAAYRVHQEQTQEVVISFYEEKNLEWFRSWWRK